MKTTISIFFFLSCLAAAAQKKPVAPPQDSTVIIRGAICHTGNGTIIENSIVVLENGKITAVGDERTVRINPKEARLISAEGLHLYPALIAPNTIVGLSEIELVRATNDMNETGNYNPGIRSLTSFNTDSRTNPTLLSNGVLLVQSVPQGGVLSGTSSIFQLDAWNWEDAVYQADDALHLNWPAYFSFQFEVGIGSIAVNKDYNKQVNDIRNYFAQARSYCLTETPEQVNLNYEAMRQVFNRNRQLFIRANDVKEILNAIHFSVEQNIRIVISGGRDSYLLTEELKKNSIPVILGDVHSLPSGEDVPIYTPFETAAKLQRAGVLYALSVSGFWQQRNLPFMAGQTVAYGVTEEEALQSITKNTARILQIENRTGSIEPGKDANLILSAGDLLDVKTSHVVMAFIQGRRIDLYDWQKEMNDVYLRRYGKLN